MFALIGVVGEWQDAMDTFSQVLVATAIAVVIGVVLGVLAAESERVSRITRPINDVLQTLPQLVYIIPFIYVFPISCVPGVIASVLYALPVVIRLVERGVRDVAPPAVEAAGAFGATRLQMLVKVKIPLARDAIMLGDQPGDHHGARRRRDRRARRLGRARLRGGAGPAAEPVRLGRRRVDRDPRPGHRPRPGHAGATAVQAREGSTDHEKCIENNEGGGECRSVRARRGPPDRRRSGGRGHCRARDHDDRDREDTASCGTVTLNEQAWTGSTANTYVAKYVLEKYLGCKVKVTDIAEIPVYQAMAKGKVDAVLEDWQHVAQYKQYITKQKTVGDRARTASTGHIGWFIPTYLMKQYPEFATWKGLKGHESVFKTPEAPQGMFLGGDPSYEQKDTQLIQALGLNLKHVTVGAETAEVARLSQLNKQKKPVIFYWWTPEYRNTEFEPRRGEAAEARQELPGRRQRAKAPLAEYKCAYRPTRSRRCSARSSWTAARRLSPSSSGGRGPRTRTRTWSRAGSPASTWIRPRPRRSTSKSHMSVVNKWLGK